jgi:hypothetical protein
MTVAECKGSEATGDDVAGFLLRGGEGRDRRRRVAQKYKGRGL